MDEDGRVNPKVSGYLEKKGKMKVMSSYKKYWFVLEGRLLLYYRSKDEYEAISPCKGSINLGPPCNVKPCPALPGVFQIETKTSTTTLRAEDREGQNRWMHGIMSALNQNKNSTKLSHFRYSLDELPHQVNKDKLQGQNSLPPPDSSKNHSHEGIIQRLQKMGAQSYGGSAGTINKIANNKKAENINKSNSTESLQYTPVDLTAFRSSVLIENDQYEAIKKNVVPENVEVRRGKNPVENIYERISRDSMSANRNEVNYSIPNKKTESEDTIQLQKSHTSVDQENSILRKMVEDKNDGIENLDKASTFLLVNEIYGTAKTVIDQKDKENIRKSVILENDNYCSVDKVRCSNDASEEIYAEPKCTEFTDHNENNVTLSNSQNWSKREENDYSIIKLNDGDENGKNTNPGEYEDLYAYGEYTEPNYQTTEDIYAECSENSTTKPKKEKKKKLRKGEADNEKKEMKLKKTSSFIKRVWKKKSKHKQTEENIDELYETVPATVVEKVSINDDTAVQMLSELHSILEHKKPILKERLSTEIKPDRKADERPKDKKTATNVNTTSSPTRDETTVQMLCELQNILGNKKSVLTGLISSDKDLPVDKANRQNNLVENENKITANINAENGSTSTGSEKINPSLPLKHQKIDVDSPYHDVAKNNQPINKILPVKKKQSLENVKSLDEILDDLDKEKTDDFRKNKVKKLIKQFSESEFTENDVILRIHKENYHSREDADTDELSRLLDELAKVTCAPILTPGVTTSLINPHIRDAELLKLLPTRCRRYSEPDYDIPRPHKSLTNLPRKENPPEGVIGSTRFFGPILQPSDVNIKTNNVNLSEDMPSMTPDSLELDAHLTTCLHPLHSPEDDKTSYTSHNYIQLKHYHVNSVRNTEDHVARKNLSTNDETSIKYFDNILIENDIYAQPKSLRNVNTIKGYKINDADHHLPFKSVKHKNASLAEDKLEDNFVDSLEI